MYVNVENVNFAYDKKPILHDINFGMNKGEITGLIGPNGCKLCLNGMPVPLLRNCYSIFNGTKYR